MRQVTQLESGQDRIQIQNCLPGLLHHTVLLSLVGGSMEWGGQLRSREQHVQTYGRENA